MKKLLGIALSLLLLGADMSNAAETAITGYPKDAVAVGLIKSALIAHPDAIVEKYDGHQLWISIAQTSGVSGWVGKPTNPGGTSVLRTEFDFTLLDMGERVQIFGNVKVTQVLNNGMVEKIPAPDGDLQTFLDSIPTAPTKN
jgi:hypothetical protein